MVVLGIDQGIAHCGFAILNVKNNDVQLLDYGCIVTKADGDQPQRLFGLLSAIERLIIRYNPQCICHERLFFSTPAKNSRKKSASILNTNMVTGGIWYMAGKHKKSIFQYSPQTVKKTVCGSGRADKTLVIDTVSQLFDIKCSKTSKEHICDAVAIALTYLQNKEEAIPQEEEV